MSQFYEMCDFFNWGRDDDEKQEARKLLHNAMAEQFNTIYGEDVANIEHWINLCQVLRITPIPDGLEGCREAIANTHVNIIDLIEEGDVAVFESEQALSVYTKLTGKFFPRDHPLAGGLLRFLLRMILNPRSPGQDGYQPRRGRGGRRGGHGRGRRGRGSRASVV